MQKQRHMQDPEFEKRVRQKMEELKFTPSASAWDNVEKELNKDKRRKRPLIWFFLFLGLAVSGSFYFFMTSQTHRDRNTINPHTAATLPSTGKEKTQTKTDDVNSAVPSSTNTDKKINPDNTSSSTAQAATGNSTKTHKTITDKDIKKSNEEITSKNNKEQAAFKKSSHTNNHTAIATGNYKNKKSLIQPTDDQDNNKPADGSIQKNQQPEIASNNNNKEVQPKETSSQGATDIADTTGSTAVAKNVVINKVDTTANKNISKDTAANKKSVAQTKKTSTKKSWKIGYTGSAGYSSVFDDLFNTTAVSGQVPTSYNLANASFAVPQSNTLTFGAINYNPSTIKPGISFTAGAFAEKSIAKKLSFSIGLNYHYYSSMISVGRKVEANLFLAASANATGYYLNTRDHSYTNQYHFIELPVSILYQFNKSKKMPIYGEAGLSLARMISSNVLHFDRLSAVYYKGNSSLFNKTQLNADIAIMIGIPIKNNMFRIGPQVQYGISNLLSGNAGNDEHLFFGGIKIVFIPNKK